jgi:aspartyl/asparaginyl beta-hydroxylase (cupin superfamily)
MSEVTDLKQLLADGEIDEMEVACNRRIETHPDDVTALNLAALGALRRKDAQRACALLEHAARLAPQNADTHYHLGRAREALGDLAGALAADEVAARLAPENPHFRLHLALGLERQGEQQRSLLHFARALKDAQSQGQWKDAASTPAALRPQVEQAVSAVRRGQRTLFDQLLEPLVNRYGRSALERVINATRIYIGEQQPVYANSRQRATFFFIPGLPPSVYFDRRLFPWIPDYEEQYQEIRRELEALLPSHRGKERVFGDDALESENLDGSNPSWTGYYFFRHGERRQDNCAACPITAAALDGIELIHIRAHGPEVLHSVFTPGTHLLPHRGVTNARAVSHLPMVIPSDCALRVGGEERAWREGQTLIFDDTYEHEAWNRSVEIRVVLIADVWNPYLSDVERAAVTDVIAAIGDLRTAVDCL